MSRDHEQTVRLARELAPPRFKRQVADLRFWRLLSTSAEEKPWGDHDAR